MSYSFRSSSHFSVNTLGPPPLGLRASLTYPEGPISLLLGRETSNSLSVGPLLSPSRRPVFVVTRSCHPCPRHTEEVWNQGSASRVSIDLNYIPNLRCPPIRKTVLLFNRRHRPLTTARHQEFEITRRRSRPPERFL